MLELWLVAHGDELGLQRTDGSWVPTIEEATQAAEREAELRRRLEGELAQLRAEQEHRDG